MMDKVKVLPVAPSLKFSPNPAYRHGYIQGQIDQRDADYEVLQRDYVPKERVKPLVEAAKKVLRQLSADNEVCPSLTQLEVALAQLGVEAKL